MADITNNLSKINPSLPRGIGGQAGGPVILGQQPREVEKPPPQPKWNKALCWRLMIPLNRDLVYYFSDEQEDRDAGFGVLPTGAMRLPKSFSVPYDKNTGDGGDFNQVVAHNNLSMLAIGCHIEIVKKPLWWDMRTRVWSAAGFEVEGKN